MIAMDLPQILLLIAIFILSIILTVIGVQLIMLLRDARDTLKKADNLLNDLEFLSHSFTRAGSSIAQLSSGLSSGVQLVSIVSSLLSNSSKSKK